MTTQGRDVRTSAQTPSGRRWGLIMGVAGSLFLSGMVGFSAMRDGSAGSEGGPASKPEGAGPRMMTAGPGYWEFKPGEDVFSDKALLDLRGLNEAIAGQHGFIRAGADGETFVRGDGREIRFWAVNDGFSGTREAVEAHARFLAKRGVNMVRLHRNLSPTDNPDSQLSDVNESSLSNIFLTVAAMKSAGIYLTISPYYAHNYTKTKRDGRILYKHWGITEGSDVDNPAALLFFHPGLQAAYKVWIKALFTRINPYTGIPLKEDPAFAIFQIQNEDGLFFWSLAALKGPDLDLLRGQFGQWLLKKYGSLAKAREAWQSVAARDAKQPDDWDRGLLNLSNPWIYFQPQLNTGGTRIRLSDEVEFLTATMRNWNLEVARYVHEELGAGQLINPGNWKTVDTTRLNDLERYSYTGSEVIGVNRYFSGEHDGEFSGWAVKRGDRYTNKSAILSPDEFPLALKQVAGKTMIVPESNWTPPNAWQSEAPFLVSIMQSLTGVDALYWWCVQQAQWYQPRSANGFLDSIGKWLVETPEIMGNFPAAALIYRNRYVESGMTVVTESRPLDELWDRRVPLISEEGGFDPNRDKVENMKSLKPVSGLSQLTYLVGPVKVVYGGRCSNEVVELSRYLDFDKKTVTSITGQIRWNYGTGVVQLDAPCAQGVSGFLKSAGGRFDLSGLSVESSNDYATVVAVSMDGAPLASSHRILVQAGTQAWPTGWSDCPISWQRDDGVTVRGFKILQHGKAPWLVANTLARIKLVNQGLAKATVLDPNGMAERDVELSRDGGAVSLSLPANAKYVVLHD